MAATPIDSAAPAHSGIRPWAWVVIGIGCAAALWFWGFRPVPPPTVRTGVVVLRALEVPFVVDGEVDAPRTPLAPTEPVRVARILVREGDTVVRGQPLAEFDRREATTGLAEALAARDAAVADRDRLRRSVDAEILVARRRVDVADAALREAVARRNQLLATARPELVEEAAARRDALASSARVADADVVRSQALFDEGAVSRADLDRAIARRDTASAEARAAVFAWERILTGPTETERATVDATVETAQGSRAEAIALLEAARAGLSAVAVADSRIRSASASVERARSRKSDVWLRAPFPGRIARVHGEPGALAGPSSPVVSVIETARTTVLASVPDDQSALVSVGQRVSVTAPAFPGRTFAGRVLRMAPVAELRTDSAGRVHAVRVRIRLDSAAPGFLPGMEVDVAGAWKMPSAGLVVPDSALVYRSKGPIVWRLRRGTVSAVPVGVGLSAPAGTVVEGDVVAGDKVVVGGKDLLRDGGPAIEEGVGQR